jgi:hypothetical protein
VRALEALLELEDEAFVEAAYEALLARAPDPEGRGSYLEQLREGTPKIELLAALALSAEGRAQARGSPALCAAVLRALEAWRERKSPEARNLEELLSFHDEAFLRAAYLAVLGREADEEGLASYLPALRAGASKIRVLAYLRGSRESAEREAALASNPKAAPQRALLAQVDRAVRRDGWQRVPFAGRWIAAALGLERDDEMHAKLRRMENALYRLTAESRMPADSAASADSAVPVERPVASQPEAPDKPLLRPAASAAALLSTLPMAPDR